MLDIQQLCKSFADGDRKLDILSAVDLELKAGEFLALLGRSGSGKSTLLNCIAGLEPVDGGCIRIDGQEMTALSEHGRTLLRRRRIGIVFQFFELLPTLNVVENVALPAMLDGMSRRDAMRKAQALLDRLELGDRSHEFPDHLSGGEKQRVATARALVQSPALLLADEPTGNLDAAAAAHTLLLFEQLRAEFNIAIVMATHSREAAAAAQKRARLIDGQLQWIHTELGGEEAPRAAPELRTQANPTPVEPGSGPGAVPEARADEFNIDAILEEQQGAVRPRASGKLSAEEIASMRLQARRDDSALGDDQSAAERST